MNYESIIGKKNTKVLLIGDVILDLYTEKFKKKYGRIVISLGGASNVAYNLKKMGIDVDFISFIGKDLAGKLFLKLSDKFGVNTKFIKKSSIYKTTYKKRNYIFGFQNKIYFRDNTINLRAKDEKYIQQFINQNIKKYDYIILSDYNKGILSEKLINNIIDVCRKSKIKVFIDSKRKLELFKNSYLLKYSIEDLSNLFSTNDKSKILNNLIFFKKKYKIDNIVVTLSEKGCYHININNEYKEYINNNYVEGHGIGAGDVFFSVLFRLYIEDFKFKEIFFYSNLLAGASITSRYTCCLNFYDILVNNKLKGYFDNKVISLRTFNNLISDKFFYKKKIGFTNGCFDLIHAGHISSLVESSKKVDILVLGLNSDNSIKVLKGKNRPIINFEDRAYILSNISVIDFIIKFDERSPQKIIKKINPDLLFKGSDYRNYYKLNKNKNENKMIFTKFISGHSTTSIISRIIELYNN